MIKKVKEQHFLIQTAAINALNTFIKTANPIHVNNVLPSIINPLKHLLPNLVNHILVEKRNEFNKQDDLMEQALKEEQGDAIKRIKKDYEATQMVMVQCIYTIIEILQFTREACTASEEAANDIATQEFISSTLNLLNYPKRNHFDEQQLVINAAETLNVLTDENEGLVSAIARDHPHFLNSLKSRLDESFLPLSYRVLLASILFNMRLSLPNPDHQLMVLHDITPLLMKMMDMDPVSSFIDIFHTSIIKERNHEEGRGRLMWWNELEALKISIEVLSNMFLDLGDSPDFFKFVSNYRVLSQLDSLYACLSKDLPSDMVNQDDHQIDIEHVMLSDTFISLITCFNNYFISSDSLDNCSFAQALFDDLCSKMDTYESSLASLNPNSEKHDRVVDFLLTSTSTLASMLRASHSPLISITPKHMSLFVRLFEKYHVMDVRRLSLSLIGLSTLSYPILFLENTSLLLSKAILEDNFSIVSEAIDLICDLFGSPQHDALFHRHQFLFKLKVVSETMHQDSFVDHLNHLHPSERDHL
eukprot:CAMPEP_0117429564 /NCGR_PEP_ID=MMETSP0758-20121206/9102_1 /TAXON_ID=63605 /ORGANISM="Percolomonas cosmopolitus, Strain AE-1 (ATCC 50343)" /LENGTH=530 /DNA_ID=CAMNT_0005216707 /DNA_START=244 /DNA_END=1833 /DNA_ORIENTATION=-